MDKPKCRLCGHKHWGDEHVWDETNTDVVIIKKPEKWEKSEIPIPGVTDKATTPEKPRKKKFDRVAYQREYMRKRRSKK